MSTLSLMTSLLTEDCSRFLPPQHRTLDHRLSEDVSVAQQGPPMTQNANVVDLEDRCIIWLVVTVQPVTMAISHNCSPVKWSFQCSAIEPFKKTLTTSTKTSSLVTPLDQTPQYLAVHCVPLSVPLSEIYCTYHVTDSTNPPETVFRTLSAIKLHRSWFHVPVFVCTVLAHKGVCGWRAVQIHGDKNWQIHIHIGSHSHQQKHTLKNPCLMTSSESFCPEPRRFSGFLRINCKTTVRLHSNNQNTVRYWQCITAQNEHTLAVAHSEWWGENCVHYNAN